ncbi:MAG TPA: DUF86 domain-containing protein [Thermoanaerobaculia bacterium]|nr:DUF86 domain-containing protein [Thermoanaerobaculia bacterium]
MRRDEQRLQDILEAISKIEKFAREGRTAFEEDERTQVWMVHHVQIIGEAARALSEGFLSRHSDIPWAQIVGMRHILVHDYFGIDLDEVWSVVERDLPVLGDRIKAILASGVGES